MYRHISIYIYICVCVSMHVHLSALLCVCVGVHMGLCVCLSVHTEKTERTNSYTTYEHLQIISFSTYSAHIIQTPTWTSLCISIYIYIHTHTNPIHYIPLGDIMCIGHM